MYTVPLCRPLSWCSTEFPDNITVTVTLGAVVKGELIRLGFSVHVFSLTRFTLTLGGLIADDEAIYFSQTGCPLQHSFGICHIDDSKMCWRGGYCQEKKHESKIVRCSCPSYLRRLLNHTLTSTS